MNAIKLAELAVAAQVTDFHLRTLATLAQSFPAPSRAKQESVLPEWMRIKFEDSALPIWEISTIGAVRRAARAANEFLDLLESLDGR